MRLTHLDLVPAPSVRSSFTGMVVICFNTDFVIAGLYAVLSLPTYDIICCQCQYIYHRGLDDQELVLELQELWYGPHRYQLDTVAGPSMPGNSHSIILRELEEVPLRNASSIQMDWLLCHRQAMLVGKAYFIIVTSGYMWKANRFRTANWVSAAWCSHAREKKPSCNFIIS